MMAHLFLKNERGEGRGEKKIGGGVREGSRGFCCRAVPKVEISGALLRQTPLKMESAYTKSKETISILKVPILIFQE